MTTTAQPVLACSGLMLCLASGLSVAQGAGQPLNLSIQPSLFASEFVTSDDDELREARFNSGLGLSLASSVLALDVDYQLCSVLKQAATVPHNALSQQFRANLQSELFNDLLGVDAGVYADSVVHDAGASYRYQISPGVSRSLSELARLRVNYDYVLDKSSRQQLAREKRSYSMALDGSLQEGRLSWSGGYRSASMFEERIALTRASEVVDLKSRYRIGSTVHLELSSEFRHETRSGAASDSVFREKRYAASVAWSPSAQYSLAFRVNTLQADHHRRRDTFGRGTLSWFPRPELELILDYGDRIADGAAGWMLHTRLDING